MALGSQPRWTVRPTAGLQADVDVGLRDYMLRIYNYMASGLALTGIVAYVFAQSGMYASAAQTPVIWLIMLAPLGLVMWLSYGIDRMSASTAQALFWVFAAVMGLSMASIFIAQAFGINLSLTQQLTLLAVLLSDIATGRYMHGRELFLLVGAALLENCGYRQVNSWWGCVGTLQAFTGKGGWGTMKRQSFGS